MLKIADRVLEFSNSAGTGDIVLSGAATGHQAFSAAWPSGAQLYYCIEDGTNWEVGSGTFVAPSALVRDVVHSNSTGSTAKIAFPSGQKRVFSVAPASIMMQIPATGQPNAWVANQSISPSVVASSASITLNSTLSNNFRLVLGHNAVLNKPSNLLDGMVLNLMVIQNNIGGFTLNFHSSFKFPLATVQYPEVTPNSISLYSFYYDATLDALLATSQKGYG